MAAVTVKHVAASAAQLANIRLLCQIGKQMGANAEQLAGALATMTQESGCNNLPGGDRDSAGLFQQRPSQNWGTYAQVTNPTYAIKKFMTPYLHYCRAGHGVIEAAQLVQGSGFPQAPAQWLPESRIDVGVVMGSRDFADTTSQGTATTTKTTTRAQPYEFSRGNAGQKETSWDAMGRLAQEVQWDRFMRAGALWFVSENWLRDQQPRFVFAQGARGVLSITQSSDNRQAAAEMTVTALAKRWSVTPGDVVLVTGQGPGDGLWLVSDTRRDLASHTTDITLKRPSLKLAEPAPQTTTTTTNVAGANVASLNPTGNLQGPAQAQTVYNAAQAISDRHLPYTYGGGHGAVGTPGPGFDCSGSVCAALAAANLGYHTGGPCDVSGTMASSWGAPGRGRWFTVWANVEHVWMQWTGVGRAWRFDTSPHNCGPDGPAMRYCARETSGFVPRHWPGL